MIVAIKSPFDNCHQKLIDSLTPNFIWLMKLSYFKLLDSFHHQNQIKVKSTHRSITYIHLVETIFVGIFKDVCPCFTD